MEQKVNNNVEVPRRSEQLRIIEQKDFILRVEDLIESGTMLYPEVQKAMQQRFIGSQLLESIAKMERKGLWIHPELLKFWMQFADKKVKDKLSPCVALLVSYRQKHPQEPWSQSFVSSAVKQPHFVELFNNLDLKLSEEDHMVLVTRPDIVDILSGVNRDLRLSEKALLVLAEDYEKFLANTKNRDKNAKYKYTNPAAFAKIQSSLTDQQLLDLMLEMGNVSNCISGVETELLKRHCFDISRVIIDNTFVNLKQEDIQEILQTPNASALLETYLNNDRSVGDLQVEVFNALDPQSKLYAHTITKMLRNVGEGIKRDFVLRLAALPDNVFEDIEWGYDQIVANKQLWTNFLQTNKALMAMQNFRKGLDDKHARKGGPRVIPDEVAEAMFLCPNVVELIACFKGWYFSKVSFEALQQSPYIEEIKDVFNLSNLKYA